MGIKEIENSIEALKIDANESDLEMIEILSDQLISAWSYHFWTRYDLTLELKQENDILDEYDQDTEFYEQVRQIQDDIINFFGADDELDVSDLEIHGLIERV